MTLALYGKSNKRRGILILAALFAVLTALIGGAVVQNAGTANAARRHRALQNPGGNGGTGAGTCGTDVPNAQVDAGTFTTCTNGQTATYTTFGFAIPAGSTINGIEVTFVNSTSNNDDSDGWTIDVSNGTFGGGKTESTNDESSTPDDSESSGGTSDLWGKTWTVAQANAIQVRFTAASGDDTMNLDNVKVRITYTPPDTDGDGVPDGTDTCPGTLAGAPGVNSSGCDWAQQLAPTVVTNPPRPNTCNIDFSLVLDRSASFNSTELATEKTASKTFIDAIFAIPGNTPTFRVVGFADLAIVPAGTQPYTTAATAKAAVDNITNGTYTNWGAGMTAGNGAGLDWMIVITDGNPNRPGSGSDVSLGALTSAVTAGNAVKTGGAHITVIGVDSSGNNPNGFDAISQSYAALVGNGDVLTGTVPGLNAILATISNSCVPPTSNPTVAKSAVSYDASFAYWNIIITNTQANSAAQNNLVITDGHNDATLNSVSATTGTGSCSSAIGSATPWTCSVGQNSVLRLQVKRPLSAASNANNPCLPGTIANYTTAALASGAPLTVNPGGSNTSEVTIDIAGNPNACARTVTITKVKQGGAAGDTTTFGGTITNSAGGWSQATSNNGSFSTDYSMTSQAHQVDETTPSAPWSRVGYYRTTGLHATCPGTAASYGSAASAAVPADTNNYTVCVLNQARQITVKKVAVGGDDTFAGTISNDGTFSLATSGGAAGQNYYVNTSQTHQVDETPVPTNWILDGYKKLSGLNATCPDTVGSYTASDNTVPADGLPYTVCIHNTKKGRLIIHKVNLGGTQTDQFQGNYDGPGSNDGTFTGLVPASPQSFSVPEGSYTVQEDVTDANSKGYDFIGAFGTSQCDAAEGAPSSLLVPTPPVLDGAIFGVKPGSDTNVYLCNRRQTGHITVNKVVIPAAGQSESGKTFNLQVDGSTAGTGGNVGDGGTTGQVTVLTGNHTVGETGAGADLNLYTRTIECVNQQQQPVAPSLADPLGASYPVIVNAGDNWVCTITNARNPVAAPPKITVFKHSDPAGNMTGTGGLIDTWTFTINGKTGPATGFTATQSTSGGSTVFDGIPEGDYEVIETTQAGWKVIGSTVGGINPDNDAARTEAGKRVTAVNGSSLTVDFYNQPRVNIHVHKDTVTNAGKQNGAGWTFTLTGCSITPQVKTTDASGNADFTDLPPCATYSVAETTVTGWTVSPSASQAVSATVAGSTASLTFVNTNIQTCGIECTPRTVTTPTTTPTTPTATPEKTKEPEKTAIAGERTPGAESTPIAPSTGNGFFGGGSGGSIALAILGLMAMSAGFAFLALGRKRA